MTVAKGQGKEKRKEGIPSRHSGYSLEPADRVVGVHGWDIIALALMCLSGSQLETKSLTQGSSLEGLLSHPEANPPYLRAVFVEGVWASLVLFRHVVPSVV